MINTQRRYCPSILILMSHSIISLLSQIAVKITARRRGMYLLRWFLATLPLASLSSGQSCYWPNGVTATALKVCSIASSNEVAACCFADHYCLTDGLCLSPTEGTWYRGGCTDERYQKTGCPRYCDTGSSRSGVHFGVSVCPHGLACQGDDSSSQNFTVGAFRAVTNAALSTDLTDSAATATGISTGAATDPTCPSTGQAGDGITTGTAAGIGVGVGLPLIIAVAALTFMLMREKKKSIHAQGFLQQQPGYGQQPQYDQQPYTSTPSPWEKSERYYAAPAEVSGTTMPHELASTQSRHELDH